MGHRPMYFYFAAKTVFLDVAIPWNLLRPKDSMESRCGEAFCGQKQALVNYNKMCVEKIFYIKIFYFFIFYYITVLVHTTLPF